MPQPRLRPAAAALLGLAALPAQLPAQPAESAPVIVTATRLDEDAPPPTHVTVLTGERIRASAARTLPELLALEAGVLTRAYYGNHAARATVDIRGFGMTGTQNTLILLDGRRLNDVDLSAVDFAAIPLDAVERVEIVRGAGGVLYGDGAVGGAINVVTRAPGRTGTRVAAWAGGGSFETWRAGATLDHGGERFALRLTSASTRTDGYRENNDLEQDNLQLDLRLPGETGEWFLKAGTDFQRLGLPGARTVDETAGTNELETDPKGAATPADFALRHGRRLTTGVVRFLDGGGELVLDLGWRWKNQASCFYCDKSYSSYRDTVLETWSLTPRLHLPHRLSGRSATLRAGVDLYVSRYRSDRSNTRDNLATPFRQVRVWQHSLALYGQETLALTDRTWATFGARYQAVRLRGRDKVDPSAPGYSIFVSEAKPRDDLEREHMLELGLRHRLRPGLEAYGQLSRAVRFATIDEFFQLNKLFLQEFSPLEPQTSVGLTVGIELTRGPHRLSAAAYAMRLRNEIHYDPSTFQNVNLDPTRREGIELGASTRLRRGLDLRASYAYTRARFREGSYAGKDVPMVPRHTAGLDVVWQTRPGLEMALDLRYTGSKRMDNDQSNTFHRRIPAYTWADLRLAYRAGGWRVEGRIENLLDTEAYDYAVRSTTSAKWNAYPLPERAFYLTVRYDGSRG